MEEPADKKVRNDVHLAISGQVRTPIDPRLLEILVCPLTHSVLEYSKDKQELISAKASLAFPVRDGIAIMLHDEARKI